MIYMFKEDMSALAIMTSNLSKDTFSKSPTQTTNIHAMILCITVRQFQASTSMICAIPFPRVKNRHSSHLEYVLPW
jgi:hypothetical protein